jgi:ketosteroid isomerase-like protein
MPHENEEIVRASVEAFTELGWDGVAEFWDPDIRWRAIEGAPDDFGELRGAAAVRSYCQDWIDMFDDLELTLEGVRAIGEECVVAEQHVTGRAKLSGAMTELRYTVVYTVRDGKIARGREYATLEQALEAAGASSWP